VKKQEGRGGHLQIQKGGMCERWAKSINEIYKGKNKAIPPFDDEKRRKETNHRQIREGKRGSVTFRRKTGGRGESDYLEKG